eukprot:SAG22_NODE_4033_length_1415_cov_1.531155_2_plen_196_part_01
MVVMPFVPKDLKNVLKALRHAGDEMTDIRVARIAGHLMRALAHLKLHDVVHRDVKLDNILLASPGTDHEAALLTDFGMCYDFRIHGFADGRVPYPTAGFPKGGAPIAMAPEIILQQPGVGQFLCYGKNDEWAVGIVVYELLATAVLCAAGFVPHRPFPDFEHPETYADADYRDINRPDTLPLLRDTVRELLRLDPA